MLTEVPNADRNRFAGLHIPLPQEEMTACTRPCLQHVPTEQELKFQSDMLVDIALIIVKHARVDVHTTEYGQTFKR